ncbi:MAG: PilT/PilU family type 4a pilus ATPase [Candidatus Magasanikbacteria bacterium]|nr:PilT/PilU family type 4a pilus ATPase [Candidatus Magasanikbacteria bacterium]
MKQITSYFEYAAQNNASDVHLVSNDKPFIRKHGELQAIEETVLPAKELEIGIFELLSKDQQEKLKTTLELDFGLEIGGGRFRVNVHYQQGTIGLAARLIPYEIPTPEILGLPQSITELSKLYDGLVLVTGPTGSGKSTTLAALINEINKTRNAHIVTIEDPIEFIFKNDKSLIEQREVGVDTKSFHEALKRALRQDPNVILVGEMRDPETISATLTAAETGHLVFSTLHTPSAAEAVERIVDVFEGFKQRQVLVQLGAVLRAVIAQELVPKKGGGLVAAREILINTPAVANLIHGNNISQIQSTMQTGVREGMVTMVNALKDLLQKGLIDQETFDKRATVGMSARKLA